MKVKFGFLLVALLTLGFAVQAQGFQRRTVEERVKAVHEKFDAAFKLEAAKQANVDSTFANFYRGTDKLREEMRAGGGGGDRSAMREKFQPLMDARDKELQSLLTAEQYDKWKKEIEPTTMRRPGGGGQRQ